MKLKSIFHWVSVVATIASSVSVVLTDSPVRATVLADGEYSCATGTIDGPSPRFSVSSGVLTSGTGCSGAVVVPAGVTSIGNSAFMAASAIQSVTISEGVTSIGLAAFMDATSLTSVSIPASVSFIGGSAFSFNRSLVSVSFAANSQLTSIEDGTFNDAWALTSISIPAGVTSIGIQAFRRASSLTSVSIPAGVTSIGNSAFSGASSLTSISIPAGVTSIGSYAFSGTTSLVSVSFAANSQLTTLRTGVFSGATSLTSVSIPAGVTSIGNDAFRGASSLVSVSIPAGVTSIGDNAFRDATSLVGVYFLGDAPGSAGASAFDNIGSSPSVIIEVGSTGFGAVGDSWLGGLTVSLNYLVTFNLNGGSTVNNRTFFTGASVREPTAPTRAGYTFAGWSLTNRGAAVTFPYTPNVPGGVVFFANWTGNSYQVSFDANGGSVVASGAFSMGASISEPTAPTRAGFTFAGWSLTNGGAAVTFPYTPNVPGGVVFFANWTAVPVVQSQPPVVNVSVPTFSNKRTFEPRALARQVGVKIVSSKASVSVKVSASSRKICTTVGSRLRTLKAGRCVVTFTVQEPKPKKGKQPKPTRTVTTLIVQ